MQDRKGTWRIACAALVVGVFFAGAATAQTLGFELVGGVGSGDGGPALQANLTGAGDAEYDGAGNLYIVQKSANRIRKIAPNGTITTVVGGTRGFAGDGGLASAARIHAPGSIAFDGVGNLYFTDAGNFRVRRITPGGVIATVAGNGSRTHSGDGGNALAAGLADMGGIAVDAAGNLYVSEPKNHLVRKVATNGIITTIAGTGVSGYSGDNGAATAAQFNAPYGLDVDAAGNLFIADQNNNAIRRIATTGTITTAGVLGSGGFPINVHVDASGAFYASDLNACLLFQWAAPGASPTLVAGMTECGPQIDGQVATLSKIGAPDGIAIDPLGNVVFVDMDTSRVRRVTTSGLLQTIAGIGGEIADGTSASVAPFGFIFSVAHDAAGNLLFTDNGYRRVRRISPSGVVDTPAGNGWWSNYQGCAGGASSCDAKTFPFIVPWGIAPGDVPGQIMVADRGHDLIFSIANGVISRYAGGTSLRGQDGPASDIAIDPYGLVRTPSGDLYFADYRAQKVRRLNAGMITTLAGVYGSTGSSGDGGPATSATLDGPMAIALDAAGRVYISEYNGRRVRRFAPNGPIETFAGNGQPGTSGDGGPASAAAIGRVDGIAVHGNEVYISSDGTLRRIDANGVISTVQNWTQYAAALEVSGNWLYIGTFEGQVYRAALVAHDVAHDYDGDGRSDMLWRNAASGANTIWKAADYMQQQAVTGVTNPAWKIVAQGDFDGDGRDDIAWRNTQNGTNTIWRSGNSTTQITVTGVSNLDWEIVGAGDFDGDGKDDLVWRNYRNGANVLWRSGNSAQQVTVTGVTNLQWRIVGVGDFDDDGHADLLWRNPVSGANTIWRTANHATQIAVTSIPNLAWKVQGVGDFDGDGRDDIFWRNTSSGANQVWNAGNSGSIRAVTTVGTQAWKVVAVGDYDGDGKDDLLWRNSGNGANQVWKSANSATLQSVMGVTNLAWAVVPYTNQP